GDVEADDERQREVDPDRLHQHRGPAQHLDVDGGDPVEDLAARDPAQPEDRTEDEPDDEADDRDEQGVVEALEQGGKVVDDAEPVELEKSGQGFLAGTGGPGSTPRARQSM